MGIFSNSSPFDGDVERATDEKNTTENWGLIMDLCDRASASPKEALRSIVRQLNNRNPHVQLQTITLLDAFINNSGKQFQLEVASREFEQEFKKHVSSSSTHRRVVSRLLASLQKWAETEFRTDPQLGLVPSLYKSLQQEGLYAQLTAEQPAAATKVPASSTDPNVVSSQQEEDDIAKAIALSMKEAEKSSPRSASTLYPSAATLSSGTAPSTSSAGTGAGAAAAGAAGAGAAHKPERKVRALYDFEAAEDNELTFKAGEIILVTEDSDPNWWMGSNHRGKGLFPSNFVTSDLSEEPEQWKEERQQQRKSVQFSEQVDVKEVQQTAPTEPATIDPLKITELLHLLNEADPTGDRPDSAQLLTLEEQCLAMGPLIDAELERTDRRHAQLTKISADLVDALNLYHQLMREPPPVSAGFYPGAPPPPPHLKQYPAAPPAGYYPGMSLPPGLPPPGAPGMPGLPPPAGPGLPPPGGPAGPGLPPPGAPGGAGLPPPQEHPAPQSYAGTGPMMPPPGLMSGYVPAQPPLPLDGAPPAPIGGPPYMDNSAAAPSPLPHQHAGWGAYGVGPVGYPPPPAAHPPQM